MPETRDWPTRYRIRAKACISFMYAGAVLAGGAVSIPFDTTPWWSIFLGGSAALFACAGIIFTLMERWMLERIAVWIVAGAFACYVVLDTVRLIWGPGASPSGVGNLWTCAAAFFLRLVYLEVFNDRTVTAQDAAMRVRGEL